MINLTARLYVHVALHCTAQACSSEGVVREDGSAYITMIRRVCGRHSACPSLPCHTPIQALHSVYSWAGLLPTADFGERPRGCLVAVLKG